MSDGAGVRYYALRSATFEAIVVKLADRRSIIINVGILLGRAFFFLEVAPILFN
jgi:hypothetical protein